ncbi:MAG: M42 family metallopeptidase [Candidatus Lokiarchaeota archaeon]|jgi:putative aminopeptidase FrvX
MNLDSIKFLQEQLSNLIGVSGHEDEVGDFILSIIEKEGLADKAWKDPLGNILAIKKGAKENERVLFDAHTDEIGFMISHVDQKGFLRFVPVGGWDTRILLGQSVVVRAESGINFHGIIGSSPPHLTTLSERKKIVNIDQMYIDIGLSSKNEVASSQIGVGSVGTLVSPFVDFPNNMVRGKAFDDRTGCNVLIHLFREMKNIDNINETLLFNFAVQEEFDRIGAVTGAFKLEPTIAIAVENTTAADVPDIKPSKIPAQIGRGPAISVADKSIICSPYVNKRLIENAKISNIPYQIKKPMYGKTDAGKIQVNREGVKSTTVSVPCRYIHSPTSLLKLDDIYYTIELLKAFVYNKATV